ncbi:uncharacterized protein LOC129961957 [Argiope bruennichi]|uniref:Uncharacterized protein n=1 Tax=Argiope bruennichi TaxID=94029 RepID=A0A8T0FWR4_ARGBR|nr:uncharacterized protein LOC129961957 [Argiope bruennichi]KAF8794010.1 hypothetical protein HNY73_002035 [Argiope bruennichi]
MSPVKNIRWIVKYTSFEILLRSSHSFTVAQTVQQRRVDDDDFFHSTTRDPTTDNTEGTFMRNIWYIIVPILSFIFLCLLFCICKLTLDAFPDVISFSSARTSLRLDLRGLNSNLQSGSGVPSGSTEPLAVFVNDGYEGALQNRQAEQDSSATENPPDYDVVALSILTNQNSAFPSVARKTLESPPPQYDESHLTFK